MVVFDAETGPLPDELLLPLVPPFDETVEEFDPAKVKLGNLKDKAKIEEKIAAARATHEAIIATMGDRKEAHVKDFIEKAALSPITGRVLAVGYKSDSRIIINALGDFDMDDERDLLECFWHQVRASMKDGTSMAGWNIFGFDLPFFVRRSWHLGVEVPEIRKGRYYHPIFIDLMEIWTCGVRGGFAKLDEAARFLTDLSKPDGIDGGDFARLFFGTDEEKQTALNYLRNDLDMTWAVAQAMQVL